jgi:glycerol-3-phosphate dehydrogenase (NAD(P)+)
MIKSVGVLGGGAWGTTLALVAARAGRDVRLWARNISIVSAIRDRRENPKYLPGVRLDANVAATPHFAEAIGADALLIAVPAQAVRGVAAVVSRLAVPGTPLIICAKGLERGSGKRLSQVIAEVAPKVVPAVLSGPSFAADVAHGLPTAVTIAAASEAVALELCHALSSTNFRPYAETDIIGVELGGAVKNVLAIAAGIVAGRRLGASALAAVVARGFAELRRFAETLGARPETLMGLSGLGDLVLTCSGPQSRNFAYGLAIGEGRDKATPQPLAEGRETASVARELALRNGVDMPIVEAVADIISARIDVDTAIDRLMRRPLKMEAG